MRSQERSRSVIAALKWIAIGTLLLTRIACAYQPVTLPVGSGGSDGNSATAAAGAPVSGGITGSGGSALPVSGCPAALSCTG
jgi:hypothetical protein